MLLVDIPTFDRVMYILRGRRIVLFRLRADKLVLVSVCVSSGRRLLWNFDGLEMPMDDRIAIGRIYIR